MLANVLAFFMSSWTWQSVLVSENDLPLHLHDDTRLEELPSSAVSLSQPCFSTTPVDVLRKLWVHILEIYFFKFHWTHCEKLATSKSLIATLPLMQSHSGFKNREPQAAAWQWSWAHQFPWIHLLVLPVHAPAYVHFLCLRNFFGDFPLSY